MDYAVMLDEIIKKSGLSLRQITKRCTELNYEITPSYISQLKNGKLPPPSEEISRTLAQVCGENNPMKLVFQGYMEKAPDIIKNYILMASAANKYLLNKLSKETANLPEAISEYIDNLDILSALELSANYIGSLQDSNINTFVENIHALSGTVQHNENSEGSYFFLRDPSMEPLVPMNSHVKITPTKREFLKNRDVVAFYPKGNKVPVIRRYYEQNNNIILVPENKEHEIYFYDNVNDFNYIGKVISYKMNF